MAGESNITENYLSLLRLSNSLILRNSQLNIAGLDSKAFLSKMSEAILWNPTQLSKKIKSAN